MATKNVSIRIEEEMLRKIEYVANYEGRSINSHVLVLIREDIKQFEDKYGKIEGGISPDVNVKPAKKGCGNNRKAATREGWPLFLSTDHLILGREAAATDWPTRRIFSSGRVTLHLAASAGYSSERISLQTRRIVSPPLPDMTRPKSIMYSMS